MGWKSSGNCCVAWKTVKSPTAKTNRQWLTRYKPADDDDDARWHRTGVQEKPKLRCKGFGSERGRPNHPPCIRTGSAVIEVVEGCRSSHSSQRWRKTITHSTCGSVQVRRRAARIGERLACAKPMGQSQRNIL
jgi:hypothetical protein